MIRFEWDRDKARTNLAKHGVALSDARLVWDDPHFILRQDRHEAGEERWQIMGYAGGVVIPVVWHTYPDPHDEERVRIIGARKAERSERRAYEQGT
ncbi:MAG: BrnT family toxin [Acetobacteraceae bacterium]